MRKIFRLTEGDLRTMIKSSINKIINESYNNINWNTVDTIEFRCYYDEDDLKEAINSGEIENTEDGINEWMHDNLYFDIKAMDENGDNLDYIEEPWEMLDNYIPQEYLDLIINEYEENPQYNHDYYINDIRYNRALNCDDIYDACKIRFDTTDTYYKGAHGFILQDGTIILMDNGGDHNSITNINGVDNKWQFVEDGNPRIGENSLEVGDNLTYEQELAVGRMCRCYSDDTLYLSLLGKDGNRDATCEYQFPNYQRVLADIRRFYDEGITPQGD